MKSGRHLLARLTADYGILLALALLCAYFAWATYTEQPLDGAAGGRSAAGLAAGHVPPGGSVLVVTRDSQEDREFAEAARSALESAGIRVRAVSGEPIDARRALERLMAAGERVDAIVGTRVTVAWSVFQLERYASLARGGLYAPNLDAALAS